METQLDFEEGFSRWSEQVSKGKSKRLVQAYRQAPWRINTQRGAMLLLLAVLSVSVLWVMVSITVQAASAGLQIQAMEDEREDLLREIAGLRTDIAQQTSKSVMEQRAQVLGFQPVRPEDTTYVIIPGYTGRQSILKVMPPNNRIQQPIIKPVYTQSLWEWLLQGVLEISEQPGGFVP